MLLAFVAGVAQAHAAGEARGPRSTEPPGHGVESRFPQSRVLATTNARLRKVLAGKDVGDDHAASAAAVSARSALVDGVHLLMPAGETYDRVLVTNTHVALERHSGIVDVVPLDHALAHVKRGQPLSRDRVEMGSGPGGRPIWGEVGPGDTIRLYRQLPGRALGDIASSHAFTSFALSMDDAFHPYRWPGQTVTLALPRSLVDQAVSGELGGAGWAGGGLALDVLEEVQIKSEALRLHLGPLGDSRPNAASP
jgi:hypothetical protein